MTSEQFRSLGLKRAKVITDVRVSNAVMAPEGQVSIDDNGLVTVQTAKGPIHFDVKHATMVVKL